MKKLYMLPLALLIGTLVAQQPVFPKGPAGSQNDSSGKKLDALFSEDISDDEEMEKKVVTVSKEQVKNPTVLKNAPNPKIAPKPVQGPGPQHPGNGPQKPGNPGPNGKNNEKPLNGNWNGYDDGYGSGNNWNNGYGNGSGNNWNNGNGSGYGNGWNNGYDNGSGYGNGNGNGWNNGYGNGNGSTNYGYNEQNSWDGVDPSYYMNNGYNWTGNGYGRFCSYDGIDFYEEVVYQSPHRMVIHRYHPSGSYYLRIVRTYTWIPGGYRWMGGCNTWVPPHWGWRTVKKTRIFTGGYWGWPY